MDEWNLSLYTIITIRQLFASILAVVNTIHQNLIHPSILSLVVKYLSRSSKYFVTQDCESP